MFDISNGTIYFRKYGVSFDPSLTHEMFSRTELYKDATPYIMNPPFRSYKIKEPIDILDKRFMLVLFFNKERLNIIQLSFCDRYKPSGWDDWYEEKEIEIKKQQDVLLKDNLGNPPYEYQWGSLESVFDQRSGSSHIILTYK